MKNELSCEVVQDLLPSYVDGFTSEVTNQSIETHLQNCINCSEIFNRRKQPEVSEQTMQKQDIGFLKKRKTKLHISGGVIIAVAAVVTAVLIYAFFIGKDVDNPDLIQVEAEVKNNHIMLSGCLLDSGKGVAKVRFKNEDGVVHVTVLATLKSSFHENDFYAGYDSESVISQIRLGDRILWDNGDNISAGAAKLYETKHSYIGNMPENGESALALGIWKDIGNYTNELQTTEEPYGWKLIGQQDYAPESRTKIETQMKAYAGALIAVIDNLGYMTFEYTVDGKACSLTFTELEADTWAGQSVKKMAETPYGLQELMKILNLSDGYIGSRIASYSQGSDDAWICKGYNYKYRVVLTGRDANAQADGRYVVLTNDAGITYDEVSWSLLSSNSNDWLDPAETVIVEIGEN